MFQIGDYIRGKNAYYGITNEKMTKARVTEVLGDQMKIRVLEYPSNITEVNKIYEVLNSDELFELISQKEFEIESSEALADLLFN